MSTPLPLRCRCGTVRGLAIDLAPSAGNHIVCYCDDCQAYAHFLGGEALLDAHGGSELFQMAPAQFTLTQGSEQLRCMRLSPKGLMRWYTECCRTPVGNTLASPGAPFIGLVTAFIDPAVEPRIREQALGPILYRVMAKFAVPGTPPDSDLGLPVSLLARSVRLLGLAWLRGRARPSPVFDATGKPVSEPEILSLEQRKRFTPVPTARAGA